MYYCWPGSRDKQFAHEYVTLFTQLCDNLTKLCKIVITLISKVSGFNPLSLITLIIFLKMYVRHTNDIFIIFR